MLSSRRSSKRRLSIWLVDLALAVIFLCTFGELACNVRAGKTFAFDRSVMEALHRLASPWLTTTMRVITTTGSAMVVAAVTVGLGIYWWHKAGRWLESAVLMITMATSTALGQILKFLFARPRPDLFPWLVQAKGWSFPSGHTLAVVTLGGLLAWFVGRRLSGWRQVILWIVAGLWVGLVSLSRVYLGVHYPSDVLASLTVGGFCLLVALHVYRTREL
jgi:undecaprenyl-diphosphatase